MRRSKITSALIAAASSAALFEGCLGPNQCEEPGPSCTFVGDDIIEEALPSAEAALQWALGARPSEGMRQQWARLTIRYRRATPRGLRARQRAALVTARHNRSTTLATSREDRKRFVKAAALVSRAATTARVPAAFSVQSLHRRLVEDGGSLRTAGLQVRAGNDRDRQYLAGSMVPDGLGVLFDYLDSPLAMTRSPIELAAITDAALISIHPFADGNGRVSALMADWILEASGLPPLATAHAPSAARFIGRPGPALFTRVTRGLEASVAIAERMA